jgi:predicted SAM-dependent methyltransferase
MLVLLCLLLVVNIASSYFIRNDHESISTIKKHIPDLDVPGPLHITTMKGIHDGLRFWGHDQDVSLFYCGVCKDTRKLTVSEHAIDSYHWLPPRMSDVSCSGKSAGFHRLDVSLDCSLLLNVSRTRTRQRIAMIVDFVVKNGIQEEKFDVVVRTSTMLDDDIIFESLKQLPEYIRALPDFQQTVIPYASNAINTQLYYRRLLRRSRISAVRDSLLRFGRLSIVLGELSALSTSSDDSIRQVSRWGNGWITLPIQVLDVTDEEDFDELLPENGVDTLVAEHIWEHLTLDEAIVAAMNCYKYLKPGGVLRLAVPDLLWFSMSTEESAAAARSKWTTNSVICGLDSLQYFNDFMSASAVLSWIYCLMESGLLRKELTAKHRVQYSAFSLQALLRSVGFSTQLLEWTDENGVSYSQNWNSADGHIKRSHKNGYKSRSIIIDAYKLPPE